MIIIVLLIINLKFKVFRFIKFVEILFWIMFVIVVNIVKGIIVVVIKVVCMLFSNRNNMKIISNVFLIRFFCMVLIVLLIRVVLLYKGIMDMFWGKLFWILLSLLLIVNVIECEFFFISIIVVLIIFFLFFSDVVFVFSFFFIVILVIFLIFISVLLLFFIMMFWMFWIDCNWVCEWIRICCLFFLMNLVFWFVLFCIIVFDSVLLVILKCNIFNGLGLIWYCFL